VPQLRKSAIKGLADSENENNVCVISTIVPVPEIHKARQTNSHPLR